MARPRRVGSARPPRGLQWRAAVLLLPACCLAAAAPPTASSGAPPAPTPAPAPSPAPGTPPPAAPPADIRAIKALSLAQLMDVNITEVTSVTRKPEHLADAAASVQVLTTDDIRRSGAASLPEALRQATNLEVAQFDEHDWAISARGFDNLLDNKLLVQVDGRSVYTPIFAGVYWDSTQVFLPDVDRIEVISGPGATQWGSNAVNGVISITPKDSADTQGTLLELGGGTNLEGVEGVRVGEHMSDAWTYRVYEQGWQEEDVLGGAPAAMRQAFDFAQAGARADGHLESGHIVLEADTYRLLTEELDQSDLHGFGEDALARWSKAYADDCEVQLQAYYNDDRRVQTGIGLDLQTWDMELTHRFQPVPQHDVVWGLDYRYNWIETEGSDILSVQPATAGMPVASAFVQDEVALAPRVHVTLGTKAEEDRFSGFAWEPDARVAWTPAHGELVWGGVSRAVRAPSLIDEYAFVPGTAPYLLQGGSFTSEKVVAYQLGYRAEPSHQVSLGVSTWYATYHDVRSLEEVQPPNPSPLVIGNGLAGESYGAELTADARLLPWLRLRAGYTETRVHLRASTGSSDTTQGANESNDPEHMAFLRASADIGRRWQADADLRSISAIAVQHVPAYVELNLRLAYLPSARWECDLIGANLLHAEHAEFGTNGQPTEIPRSGYAKVVCRF